MVYHDRSDVAMTDTIAYFRVQSDESESPCIPQLPSTQKPMRARDYLCPAHHSAQYKKSRKLLLFRTV